MAPSKPNSIKKKIGYDELSMTWRAIYQSLSHIDDEKLRQYKTSLAFTQLLHQVGWTLEEWNDKTKKIKDRIKECS